MTTERRGAPRGARDGARTAVASVVTGLLLTGPVALVLGVVSLVARPAAAVRRLAVVGCTLGLLGTAAWGLWLATFEPSPTAVASATLVPPREPVRLALPATEVAAADVPSLRSEALRAEESHAAEAAEKRAEQATLALEDVDGTGDVPVLGDGTGLELGLPVRVEKFSTDGWTVTFGEGATETMAATFTRGTTEVGVVVTLHATATDAETTTAAVVRDRLASEGAREGEGLTSAAGSSVRRVVDDGRSTFVWSEFTASVEVSGPTRAARVLAERFVLGQAGQGGEEPR